MQNLIIFVIKELVAWVKQMKKLNSMILFDVYNNIYFDQWRNPGNMNSPGYALVFNKNR